MANREIATLGGGCFWCLEAVYDQMEGVISVESGYMGGKKPNPTYQEVCTGKSGYVEVVQVTFDADITSYQDILEVFFAIHDPTTRDRQGNDVGPQYRSVIFYHSDEQLKTAERMLKREFVTEVRPAETFYKAEDYHQEYFENNPQQPYCSYVVAPKVSKFRKQFAEKLKKSQSRA
jgi:peptide-methionine (S)-S-oxide reductase